MKSGWTGALSRVIGSRIPVYLRESFCFELLAERECERVALPSLLHDALPLKRGQVFARLLYTQRQQAREPAYRHIFEHAKRCLLRKDEYESRFFLRKKINFG